MITTSNNGLCYATETAVSHQDVAVGMEPEETAEGLDSNDVVKDGTYSGTASWIKTFRDLCHLFSLPLSSQITIFPQQRASQNSLSSAYLFLKTPRASPPK
jgi:hypothetical protein